MDDTAQAIEVLETHDIDRVKEALTWLARHGDITALEHTLPLVQHPHVAIRWYAKKAVRALRERARREFKPEPEARQSPPPCSGLNRGHSHGIAELNPTEVAVRHRARPRRPDYFRVDVII